MNVVTLMGRLTKDPEVRYAMGEKSTAICRYTLAVNRNRKRDGEPDADFINIVAFGKAGEFAGKYFKKGQQVAIVGSLRINNYTDRDGNKRWSTDVVVSDQYFAERKSEDKSQYREKEIRDEVPDKFKETEQVHIDDDLPF